MKLFSFLGRSHGFIARVATVLLFVAQWAEADTLERPSEPVVISGAELLDFIGVDPERIVSFSFSNGWRQIPIQVDERVEVSFKKVYNGAASISGLVTFLAYADADTFTGADTNGLYDVDDEVVFMACDAGDRAPENMELPPGTLAGSGEEVILSDGLDGGMGYVYLFESDGTLGQDAGTNYVDYSFVLASGDYKTTYNLSNGPNPEVSVVTSALYRTEFSDRWIREVEHLYTSGSDGIDLLDRHRTDLPGNSVARNEETFTAGEGAFVANIDGPVRCIRSYLGANSGPATERDHIFYRQRQEIRTFLRVHSGINGPRDTYNYVPSAKKMIYYNNHNISGVPIDGNTDLINLNAPDWEMVSGPHGTLVFSHFIDTDIAPLNLTNYYCDTASQSPPTGSGNCFGMHGLWVDQSSFPSTDPLLSATNHFNTTRIINYMEANASVDTATNLYAQAASPLQVETSRFLGDSDSDGMADAWEIKYFSDLSHQADADDDKPFPDGMDNLAEYISDTDPTDPSDYFHKTAISNTPPTICFNSSSNRLYTMLWRTNLLSGAWTIVPGTPPRMGTGGEDSMQSTNGCPLEFYQIKVQLP